MYFIGYDIGSSFIKAALLNGDNGTCAAAASYPERELPMQAPEPGWAEQDPADWWEGARQTTADLLRSSGIAPDAIGGIGISYQMHGLVTVDAQQRVIRPAIIWCDSRAVAIGNAAFAKIGAQRCLRHLLNSPGNFTASKLKWVQLHEPENYRKIHKFMLPGDYLAMKLCGEIRTTISGLSEGILWDYQQKAPADFLLAHYGIDPALLPERVPAFGEQGRLSRAAATTLGLPVGTPVTYRAGDQPNNAFSLNVLNPGEIAATAGTSGVVYAVTDQVKYDPQSRVNTFAHVNYTPQTTRLGILLCINGTGIANSWLKKSLSGGALSYSQMNELAAAVPPGAEGVAILPFGNGAERVLKNREIGFQVHGVHFNRHGRGHLIRALHEGIAFSFQYGLEILQQMGVAPDVIRAGMANMFLSPVFRTTLATISDAPVELYNSDGALGAARAAALGRGFYASPQEAFTGLERLQTIPPEPAIREALQSAYARWRTQLQRVL